MMKILLFLLFIIFSSCSHLTNSTEIKLKLLDHSEIVTGTAFQHTPVGGLSGIVYDNQLGEFWAISDDRSFFDHARVYRFKLTSIKPLKVELTSVVYLKDQNGTFYKRGHVDFEGITLLPNGNLLLSSESIEEKNFSYPPRLMEFSRSGLFIKNWAIDNKFFRAAKKGVRTNKSFESLVADGDFVYSAVENALIQDDGELTASSDVKLRVLRFKKGRTGYVPCAEFIYHLSALPIETPSDKGDSGLVELLTLDDSTLLALERSYLYRQHKNVIKLFKFNLGQNVKSHFSLHGVDTEIHKKLVLDFSSLNLKLDNIEGMAWGPKLPNGHKTLLFVSDNNFNKKQTTLFLLFEVVP